MQKAKKGKGEETTSRSVQKSYRQTTALTSLIGISSIMFKKLRSNMLLPWSFTKIGIPRSENLNGVPSSHWSISSQADVQVVSQAGQVPLPDFFSKPGTITGTLLEIYVTKI